MYEVFFGALEVPIRLVCRQTSGTLSTIGILQTDEDLALRLRSFGLVQQTLWSFRPI
jgi:hypothetical protein